MLYFPGDNYRINLSYWSMIINKTSSLAPTSQNLPPITTLGSRRKKLEILKEMNDLTDDFVVNGYNMSEYLVNKIKNKS